MVKCEICEREGGNGEIFPLCKCGKPLGCFKCRGQELSVTCKSCREKTNLFDWWRAKARPFRVGKHDEIGLIRYTPNGMPFVLEGDGVYRPVRLDRTPVRRKTYTLPTGEYLDEEGAPLFPDDWQKQSVDELNEKEMEHYRILRGQFKSKPEDHDR